MLDFIDENKQVRARICWDSALSRKLIEM